MSDAKRIVQTPVQSISELFRRVRDLEFKLIGAGGGAAYRFGGEVYFTASGTFTKASYPGLKAATIECQGGQGQGGGCATTVAGQNSAGGGGGGPSYARSTILASDIDNTEAVTVGLGGTGAAAGAAGNAGQDSVFDTISGEVRGLGGAGGGAGAATTGINASGGGGAGAATGTGDLVIPGGFGSDGIVLGVNRCLVGEGGFSHLMVYDRAILPPQMSTSSTQQTGQGRGSNNNASTAAKNGGDGRKGIVIVTLWF